MTTRKSSAPTPAPTTPDTSKLLKQSNPLVAKAKAIVVKDRASYEQASLVIDAGNGILKEVAQTFDPLIKSAHEHHKSLISTKKSFTDPVDAALTALKRSMSAFTIEQDRIRRQEEARLQEQARKDQEAAAVAEAEALEAQGESEAAAQVVEEAIAAPAPAVSLPRFDTSEFGRSSRAVWKWEIVDLAKIPTEFLTVAVNASTKLPQDISTAQIGALVRTIKNKELAEAKFKGGVEVWEDLTTF